ncbi:MAG: hypothetical protein JXA66_09450 [Oligoflexia bacterium]|nr:hypothetical protein [Oligoflexia bacterium]
MLTKTRSRIIFSVLVVLLLGVVFVNYSPGYDERSAIINSLPDIDMVEMNVMAIKEYNSFDDSIWSDYKRLFTGDYKSVVFTFRKYNLISTLFLIFLPPVAMLAFLLILGVSTSMTFIILSLFSLFTFLPLLLL